MFQLTFDKYSLQRKEDFELSDKDLPEFAKTAVQFCLEWISGKNTFIQQTSGSTGSPKKIEISKTQLIASAKATGEFFSTDENTKLLCCLNPSYIAGKMMLVRALVWNCPIHLTEPKSNPLIGLNFSPDFVAMVPLQIEACLQQQESLEKLHAIKHLIIGGAPMNDSLKAEIIHKGVKCYQTYGMTETVSHVALAKIEAEDLVYTRLPMVEFGSDERGALWISSPMSGPDRIQTNDIIEIVDTNRFKWLGRLDFIINSGGVKINPDELAKKSAASIGGLFPGSEFFFYGEKDEKLGEKVVLYIEGEKPSDGMVEVLLAALSKNLSKYELPKMVYVLKLFERTATLKIDKLKT
ncbi:MAG: AMP-binding protein, partial [Algoriphagus sp.]